MVPSETPQCVSVDLNSFSPLSSPKRVVLRKTPTRVKLHTFFIPQILLSPVPLAVVSPNKNIGSPVNKETHTDIHTQTQTRTTFHLSPFRHTTYHPSPVKVHWTVFTKPNIQKCTLKTGTLRGLGEDTSPFISSKMEPKSGYFLCTVFHCVFGALIEWPSSWRTKAMRTSDK